MAKYYTRSEVLERFRKTIAEGKPVVIAGAGTGISGKFAERGGADLVGVYNSGLYRMDGNGSLAGLMPYGNANDIVLQLADRVFPQIQEAPMIAGICGSDPTKVMDAFLKELIHLGFSAVMNFPTVGLIDGRYRRELEDTGMGYDKEIDTLVMAKELGMFTIGYAFNEEEAAMVGKAGMDVMICHMGLTTGGAIGSKYSEAVSLENCADLINRMTKKAREGNPDIIIFAHGGPISSPADTAYIYAHTESVGFLGASSIERIPVEKPLQDAVVEFKSQKLGNHKS
ncbi:MAG: phosphoenolpyruvate hydrolase family protein [Blautia sp.]